MRIQTGRAFAIFVAASFFVMGATVAISNPLVDAPEPILDSGVENPLANVGRGSLLDLVGNLTGLRGMTSNGPPVASHVLGLPLPPAHMPVQYAADAMGRDQPLRHAFLVWNKALNLQDEATLLADPELERVDSLPLDVQVAVASLLYALTDATMLQAQALDGLDADEKELLLSAPDAIMAAGPDPQAWVDDAHIAAISDAGTKIDMGLIHAATQIVTSTVAYVLPTLEAWGKAEREAAARSQRYVDDLGGYLDTHSPGNLAAMHRIERLDALSDALLMAGTWSSSIPSLAPIEPAPGASLSDALRGLADATHLPVALDPLALVQADMIPEGLQRAVARIVINHQAWMEAVLSQDPTDPASQTSSIAAAVRLVEAVKVSAPTIEAFGLLYAHNAYPALPKTPMDLPRAIPGIVLTADALVRQGTPVAALHAGFMAQGADPMAVAAPPLPPRGSLETAVLDLYERYGLDVDQDTRQKLHDDVGALAPTVERNAARMLMAQLAATDVLTALYQNLSVEDLALLESAVPENVQNRILEGDISIEDLQRLEAYYDIVDRVRDAYYEASLMVASATEASKDALDGYTQKKVEREINDAPAWGKYVVAALNFILPGASAQVIDDPCPDQDSSCVTDPLFPGACEDPEAASCENDVLFADPLLGTVVIGGFGRTAYTPSMGMVNIPIAQGNHRLGSSTTVGPQGQILSVDLGGDDHYASNAGGSILSFIAREIDGTLTTAYIFSPSVPPLFPQDAQLSSDFWANPSSIALALDFAGDDKYEPPAPPANLESLVFQEATAIGDLEAIQGSSLGGIGILWDASGNDQYRALTTAQGHGGGTSGNVCAPGESGLRVDQVFFGGTRETVGQVGFPVPCLSGLFGVGLLIDSDGDDVYSATDRAQGLSTPFGNTFEQIAVPLIPFLGGVGILADAGGNDRYTVATGAQGQGFGDAGIGMLIDGDGNDDYRGGSQGQGRNAGLGLLVDLGGDDDYTRREMHTNVRFRDGTCRATIDPGDPFAPQAPGFGIFADNRANGCTLNVFHTLADLSELDPQSIPGQVQELAESLQQQLLGAVFSLLSTDDDDVDGWPNGVETAFGANPNNASDNPGGLPAKPDDWPDAVPHPTEMGLLPAASDYILRMPGIFVLGDATNTEYPDGSDGGLSDAGIVLPDKDYLLSLDLGGADTYENRAGGPLLDSSGLAVAPILYLPTLVVSFGEGNDKFVQGGKNCVQGCNNGILLNLGGDDVYIAQQNSQGAVKNHYGIGVLFDARGNDTYKAGAGSQGGSQTINMPAGASLALFIDAVGNDVYESPGQGFAKHEIIVGQCNNCIEVPKPNGYNTAYHAMFIELAGADWYQPVGTQGHAESTSSGTMQVNAKHPAAPTTGIFLESGGQDRYQGRPAHPGSPDWSSHRNDRFSISSSPGPRGIFWDRDLGASSVDSEQSPLLQMDGLGVVIGAADASHYTTDYALLIDPGGNDLYRNNAGATLLRASVAGTASAAASGPLAAASLLLDLEGADHYDGTDSRLASEYDFSPLSGNSDPAGVLARPSKTGLLVQGTGFLGVGMLADLGNEEDLFEARGLAQGFGLLGSGILWSQGGDDTFSASPEVVRNPVLGGPGRGFAAWEELRPWVVDDDNGFTWRPMARHPSEDCRFPLLHDETRGPIRDLSLATDGSAAVMSQFLEDNAFPRWQVIHTGLTMGDACNDVIVGNANPLAKDAASNQVHPVAGPAGVLHTDRPFYVWQDDRNGEWDLYWNFGHTDSQDRTELVIPGSNQGRPAYADKTLAFEDDRDGSSSIYAIDLVSFTQSRLSEYPQTGERLAGEHIRPSLSGVLAAWQTRAEDGPWRLYVLHRLLSGAEALRIIGPDTPGFPLGDFDEVDLGQLVGPHVAGERVAFTHEVPGRLPRVMSYDWTSQEFTLQADGAQDIAIHPSRPNVLAWLDTKGTAPAAHEVAGSPLWEVRWQPDSPSFQVSMAANARYGTMMQGVAWQAGIGLLINLGGQDSYEAGHWAQGAAFSRGDQNMGRTPAANGETEANLNHGASGLLVDLDGNDIYKAQAVGQGAHFGGEFETSTLCANVPSTATVGLAHLEFVENAGVLFDLRGSDRYAADSESQGYSALVIGKNPIDRPTQCIPPWATQPGDDLARDAYVIASIGMLLDMGGRDGYAYADTMNSLVSLMDPDPQALATCTADVAAQFAEHWAITNEVTAAKTLTEEILFAEIGLPPEALDAWEALWALDQVIGDLCADLDDAVANLWRVIADNEQVVALRNEFFGDSGNRNNEVWNQPGRSSSTGGVGIDLPSTDQIGHRLRQISEDLLGVTLAPFDPKLEQEVSPVKDTVELVTSVEYKGGAQQAIQVRLVEVFIESAFVDYAKACGPNVWCLTWSTDNADWPDGDYEVQTVVHYALKGLDFTVGYVDAVETFTVNNRPRLSDISVQPEAFSPVPFADGSPPPVTVAFQLSEDHLEERSLPGGAAAWMKVEVRDAPVLGNHVATLHDFSDPPATSEGLQLLWDGTKSGVYVPSGTYYIHLEATDDKFVPERSRHHPALPFRVDSDPPTGGCIRTDAFASPCPAYVPITISKGNPTSALAGTMDLTFSIPSGNDPAMAHVFGNRQKQGEGWSGWQLEESLGVEAGKDSIGSAVAAIHGERILLLVLFEDRVGNVECVPFCGAGHAALGSVPASGNLLAAALRKVALDGGDHVTEFFADFTRPQISLPDQGRLYRLDGEQVGDGQYRLSPERDLSIHFFAQEDTSGIVGHIKWISEEDQTIMVPDDPVTLDCVEDGVELGGDDTCADGKYRITWSNWNGLLDAREWPEGRLFWEAQFRDGVGNLPSSTQRFGGKLILDRTAPVLHEDETKIDYPKGGATANRTGDVVTVHVMVTDPPISGGRFPSDWRQFTVLLNASAVTNFHGPNDSPDRLRMTPDPVKEGRFSLSFPVGRPGLDLDQPGWREALNLHIADQARNWNNDTAVDLLLGNPQLGLQEAHVHATVDSVTIEWETDLDANVTLWFGRVGAEAQPFTNPDALSKLHRFTLPSIGFPFLIEPATLYSYRIEAIDEQGLAQAAGPFLVPTLAGLDGGLTTPRNHAVLAGIVPAEGFVDVSSRPGAEVRVQLRLLNETLPGGARLAMDEVIRNSPRYSPGDVLYWDTDASGNVTPGDLRLVAFGQGLFVGEEDFDLAITLDGRVLQGGFHFFDADGDCLVGSKELVYLTRLTAAAGTVSPGDLRIGGPNHGSSVLASDVDVGRPLAGRQQGALCSGGALAAGFATLDSSGGPSTGNGAYIDGDGDGTVGPGDIRLSDREAFPAGSRVAAKDKDVGAALAPLPGHAAFIDMIGDQAFTKELVTGALPDGIYTLEASFTYQSPVLLENVTRTVTNLLIDNSPPQITAVNPAANQTLPASPDALILQVTDAWTPILPETARLRINGQVVAGTTATALETSDGGRTAFVRIALPDGLPSGPLRITVTAKDAAGNTGVVSYNIVHDGDAPQASPGSTAVEVAYPHGQQAARPGDLVRVRARLSDLTGIAQVTLDASPLGGEDEIHLLAVPQGHEATVRVGDDVKGGRVLVNLTALDSLGHRADFVAEVLVEREPPALTGFDSVHTAMDSARLGLAFDQPVQAWVLLYQGETMLTRVPAVADDLSAFPRLAGASAMHGYAAGLSGLEPGMRYRIVIEAQGASGLDAEHEKAWNFAPVIVQPPSVGGLAVQVGRSGHVQLVWEVAKDLPDRAIKYIVYRMSAGGFEPVAQTWAPRVDDRPEPGTYRYFVQAQNLAGMMGESSSIVEVTVKPRAGVSAWSVTPSRGTEQTPFTFSAVVTSATSAQPSAWMVLEGAPYRMDLASGDCRQECRFTATIQTQAAFRSLEQGFHIEVMDAAGILRGPETGEAAGPRVVMGIDEGEGTEKKNVPAVAPFLALLAATLAIGRRNRK